MNLHLNQCCGAGSVIRNYGSGTEFYYSSKFGNFVKKFNILSFLVILDFILPIDNAEQEPKVIFTDPQHWSYLV